MFFSRWLSGLLLYTVWLGVHSFAAAETSPVSVVVLYSGRDETTIRLAAELSALGYAPILLLHPSQALWTDQVRKIIKTYRAAALINATSVKKRVDIWMVDPGSKGMKLVVDTVDTVQGESAAASTILKSVETLRAGIMKVEGSTGTGRSLTRSGNMSRTESEMDGDIHHITVSQESGQSGKIKTGSSDKTVFSARPGRLSLFLGPSVTYGFGDFPPEWQVALSLALRVGTHLSVVMIGFAPTASMKLKTEYGSAKVWNSALTAGLRLDLRARERRWIPWIELGAGPHFTRMKGNGIEPYRDGDDRIVVFEMLFRGGFRVWLNTRLALEGALYVGGCLPKPVVEIGKKEASFSTPLFGGIIQLSIEIF